MKPKIIDRWGIITALIVFALTLLLFWKDSSEFLKSFEAAALTAGLVWSAYVILRMLVLSFKQ